MPVSNINHNGQCYNNRKQLTLEALHIKVKMALNVVMLKTRWSAENEDKNYGDTL